MGVKRLACDQALNLSLSRETRNENTLVSNDIGGNESIVKIGPNHRLLQSWMEKLERTALSLFYAESAAMLPLVVGQR